MNRIKIFGKLLYKWWMAFARAIGAVNAAILLTVVYIIVIGPGSIISRILRKDLLAHRGSSVSFWKAKKPVPHTLDESRHQF